MQVETEWYSCWDGSKSRSCYCTGVCQLEEREKKGGRDGGESKRREVEIVGQIEQEAGKRKERKGERGEAIPHSHTFSAPLYS